MIENAEYADGTKDINLRVAKNTIGTEAANENGYTKTVGEEVGKVETTSSWQLSEADASRIGSAAAPSAVWISQQAAMYFKAAQSNWRNYGCVQINMSATKTKLVPGERIDVSAETVHKFDKAKVNAELLLKAATDSATPEKQKAAPTGKFDLLAPAKGKAAQIIVESVSRRDIALEILEFGEEKRTRKKPVTPKKTEATGNLPNCWQGSISITRRESESWQQPGPKKGVIGFTESGCHLYLEAVSRCSLRCHWDASRKFSRR